MHVHGLEDGGERDLEEVQEDDQEQDGLEFLEPADDHLLSGEEGQPVVLVGDQLDDNHSRDAQADEGADERLAPGGGQPAFAHALGNDIDDRVGDAYFGKEDGQQRV